MPVQPWDQAGLGNGGAWPPHGGTPRYMKRAVLVKFLSQVLIRFLQRYGESGAYIISSCSEAS